MIHLITSSLRHYWRAHLGTLAGAMLASAVLTGALLVGDSVDFSLRTFAMARVGDVYNAIDTRGQLIADDLAPRLADVLDTEVAPTLFIPGMAIYQDDTTGDRAQVNRVDVYGVDSNFWAFGSGSPLDLAPFEVAINGKLAQRLGVSDGDEISLRIAKPSLMPRDSPLSWRDEERTVRNRYKVARVLNDDEMGRFGLIANQIAPYNAFVQLPFLQEQIALDGRVNMMLTGRAENLEGAIHDAWALEDLGLHIEEIEGVQQLGSDSVFLNDETSRGALTLPGARGTLTYLVNTLGNEDALTPYFFMVAGPVPDDMEDDEIVINEWVADEIGADVGDTLKLTYAYLLPGNQFEERSRTFTVHSIVAMETLEGERALMPVFPGLSDVESCADWDVGMPMDEELLNDEANEEYWKTYRATPKAFVTLNAGQEMWSSRFGSLTAVRYPLSTDTSLLRDAMDPTLAGLSPIPVRERALAAVDEAMDFGGLFLGMSFFLIIAALMLTGLLFVFSVEQRASQMGLLLAVGYRPKQVSRMLLGEGLGVAVLGAIAGAGLGALYTRALIYGLSERWQGAVANTNILYHARPITFVIGSVVTVLCAVIAMALASRGLSRKPARTLLNMDASQASDTDRSKKPGRALPIIAVICTVAAIGIILAAPSAGAAAIPPAFFGAGALLLTGCILGFRHLLQIVSAMPSSGAFTLRRLSLLNLTRRPGRSVAVVSLLASGSFMVFAVSSMQEDLYASAHERSAGTGGFALYADSTFPLLEDAIIELNDAASIVPIKVRDGDDASCLNLNKAQSPTLLGVDPEAFISREAFADPDLWRLLDQEFPNGAIPALIGDANTAMWTLKKSGDPVSGDVLIYQDQQGAEVPVQLVGQLPMRLSVFQGSIVISQKHFTKLFPGEDGFRRVLVDAEPDAATELATLLNRRFERDKKVLRDMGVPHEVRLRMGVVRKKA